MMGLCLCVRVSVPLSTLSPLKRVRVYIPCTFLLICIVWAISFVYLCHFYEYIPVIYRRLFLSLALDLTIANTRDSLNSIIIFSIILVENEKKKN